MPLAFLPEVLNNAKAPGAIKLRVADATLPIHTQGNPLGRKAKAVADRFAFTVEPALAKNLRNEIARLRVLKKTTDSTGSEGDTAAQQKIDMKLAPCNVLAQRAMASSRLLRTGKN